MAQGRSLLNFFLMSEDGWMAARVEQTAEAETDMEDDRKTRYQ